MKSSVVTESLLHGQTGRIITRRQSPARRYIVLPSCPLRASTSGPGFPISLHHAPMKKAALKNGANKAPTSFTLGMWSGSGVASHRWLTCPQPCDASAPCLSPTSARCPQSTQSSRYSGTFLCTTSATFLLLDKAREKEIWQDKVQTVSSADAPSGRAGQGPPRRSDKWLTMLSST